MSIFAQPYASQRPTHVLKIKIKKMKMKNLMKKSLVYGLFAAFALFFVSCEEEPVRGCLDSASESYNPDADENDPSLCVFARDKFIGSYSGSLICTGLLSMAINNPTYEYSIEESSGPIDEVKISLSVQMVPTIVTGTVVGNNLTINTTLEEIPFTIPDGSGIIVSSNYNITGSATISGDDLTGEIIIEIVTNGSLSTLVPPTSCPITGTK